MHTGDALLQAIRDDPDADDLRLIYADWLQDHGEPERAEFIRIEIAMRGHMPDENTAPNTWDSPEYYRLRTRSAELRAANGEVWFGAIRRLANNFQTLRGFVAEMDTTAKKFAERADEFFAAAPLLQRVYLSRIGSNMPAVVRRPEFAWIREIGFLETTLGAAGLSELCRSSHIENLRSIDCLDNRITDSGATSLAASPYLGRLEDLCLSDNPVYDSGAEAILRSGQLRSLRRLDLNNCGLTDSTARTLSRTTGTSLLELNLGNNHMTGAGARYLAQSPRLASLENLILVNNNLDQGVAALATSPHLLPWRERSSPFTLRRI